MEHLPCYNPKACCGDDCFKLWDEDEPCWGDVEVIDEQCTEDYSDCWWIHACQGHKDSDFPLSKYLKKEINNE